jgi:hypothetical protein
MKPGEVVAVLGWLFLPPAVFAAVYFAPRACEIAGAAFILAGGTALAVRAAREGPHPPLGWWGLVWWVSLFGTVGVALLAWGFLVATFLAAGYVSTALLALAADTRSEDWGPEDDGRSLRVVIVLCGLLTGAYATAGALGWAPEFNHDPRGFFEAPITVAVVGSALFTVSLGGSVWVNGLDLRGDWVRNGWTKALALGICALAGFILFVGLTVLPRLFW